MNKLIPLACLALLGNIAPEALAQEAAAPVTAPVPTTPATPAMPVTAAKPAEVTISGSRANDTDKRRMATASRMIFGREELDRNGDSNVGEILKRLPGVTMGGPPGRGGGGVRMRGLGSGYTQMLVNGERAPAGFSLESLTPDQVERIEVMRGPVAEHSTQAIAGTINIILREGFQQKDIQLRLADSVEDGKHSPSVSLNMPGKSGALTWLWSGSLQGGRQRDESATAYQELRNDGVLLNDRLIANQTMRDNRNLHLTPRLTYKMDNGDTINFQTFIGHNDNTGVSDSLLTQALGRAEYARSLGEWDSASTYWRGFGNWLQKMEGGAKLDAKFGFGGGRNKTISSRNHLDGGGAVIDNFNDNDRSSNSSLNTGGKYTTPLGEGHLLAAGWDIESGHRQQTTIALVDGQNRFPESGQGMTADTRRVALFVQDEWDISKQWSVYLGLRWEGIRTESVNRGRAVSSSTSVWSPVLHTVWRLPNTEKDQIRASLTQSYRAPQLNDLIAIPTFSYPNDATRPDRSGNPDLKPELSQGFDLAYEHYLGKSGILSASAFVRKIDNLMRRDLFERVVNGERRWLSTPSNIGSARTSGIELEAKLQLAELMTDAPNIDLRANYSRFWSDVDGIAGPYNRLDQQAAQTANLGIDYRLKQAPLTLGGSYNWTPDIIVQTSDKERVTTGVKRQFDVYGLWKLSPATQLRLSANNLANDDFVNGRIVDTGASSQYSNTAARTFTTWSLRLEMKL